MLNPLCGPESLDSSVVQIPTKIKETTKTTKKIVLICKHHDCFTYINEV